MGLFTVTVNAQVNQPPNQIGNLTLTLDFNELYVFTLADFTSGTIPQYQDPEGDDLENLKVITLPTIGILYRNGVPVVPNDEITYASIVGGLLTYQADVAETTGYSDSDMTFDISDDGSHSFSGLTPGIVSITVGADINEPPSEVGDNTLVTNYSTTIVFTSAHFTTGTTPAYADPESDPAFLLRVDSLPSEGVLKLNGVDVTVNQEITFVDIAAGLFTFVPNAANTNSHMVDFNFSIQDSGSGMYTS